VRRDPAILPAALRPDYLVAYTGALDELFLIAALVAFAGAIAAAILVRPQTSSPTTGSRAGVRPGCGMLVRLWRPAAAPLARTCSVQPLIEYRLEVAGRATRALELAGDGPPLLLLHGFADSAAHQGEPVQRPLRVVA
jgi:hypothetical protein